MVGSILLVLTFSKSADDYFGNIWEFFGNSLEILWEFFGNFSGILWDFFGNSKTVEDLTNIDKVGKLDLTSNKEKNKKKIQSLEARADAFSRLKKFVELKFFQNTRPLHSKMGFSRNFPWISYRYCL